MAEEVVLPPPPPPTCVFTTQKTAWWKKQVGKTIWFTSHGSLLVRWGLVKSVHRGNVELESDWRTMRNTPVPVVDEDGNYVLRKP